MRAALSPANAATSDQVYALCCECGTRRTVSRRYAGRQNRDLRCATCGRTTEHAPVTWRQREDWRERANERSDGTAAKIARNIAHMESFGIWVAYGTPEGGMAEVRHYVDGDKPAWIINLAADLLPERRLAMLEWAWKTMLPSWVKDFGVSWGGPILHDEYGQFRGCYYTGG